MGKLIIFCLIFLSVSGRADDSKKQYLLRYANLTFAKYTAAVNAASKLDSAIQEFVDNPSPDHLTLARTEWTTARKIYSQTEVYRFFDGPIDGQDGPEGLINAWPLDEVYIDYVIGKPDAGIIADTINYPQISEELLVELNENAGEKNISTGWHAIEFLLWGQDLSEDGPGNRSYLDYVVGREGPSKNALRRGLFLRTISGLLVKHLKTVAREWDPENRDAFVHRFIEDSGSFERVIRAAKFLADEELAMERMFVAYETRLQEDEHSCFSDTTANDIYYNLVGIRDVLTDESGLSFVDLIAKKDSILASQIRTTLSELEGKFLKFQTDKNGTPRAFDQAILDGASGRIEMLLIINQLKQLGKQIELAVVKLQDDPAR